MVLCKFFQQGNCRFGQNCRYEHIYGSKYSYYANPTPQHAAKESTNNPFTAKNVAITDEQLVQQVQTDLQSMLRGGQWIFSSYAPFKEKPSFPGLEDLSPEEARLFIYEAKANNNIEQAVNFLNNYTLETKRKYEQLLQPNMTMIKLFRRLYNGETFSSPFSSDTPQNAFGSTNASSIFRNAAQSVFQSSNTNAASSLFKQSNINSFTQNQKANIFQRNVDIAKSIFAQATQSAFSQNNGSNIFGPQSPEGPKAIFAQTSQNIFSSSPNKVESSSVFSPQDIFHKPHAPQTVATHQDNLFQRPATQNIFASATQTQGIELLGIYSKIEDLSQDDIDAFQSADFNLGFIPEVPPPQSLCIS